MLHCAASQWPERGDMNVPAKVTTICDITRSISWVHCPGKVTTSDFLLADFSLHLTLTLIGSSISIREKDKKLNIFQFKFSAQFHLWVGLWVVIQEGLRGSLQGGFRGDFDGDFKSIHLQEQEEELLPCTVCRDLFYYLFVLFLGVFVMQQLLLIKEHLRNNFPGFICLVHMCVLKSEKRVSSPPDMIFLIIF